MSFEIKIPLFEGPFDLLLFFIQRDEIDIYDIPIYQITNDFMEYLSHLEQMNIEVASEFILMASTLMRIKAKMLLPRLEKDEEGNEIDPREELVKHLLEYKKYKSVIGTLEEWEGKMLDRLKRGNIPNEITEIEKLTDVEAELQDITLYKLLRVYQTTMQRFNQEDANPRRHEIVPYPYTLEGQKERLMKVLEEKEKIAFIELMRQQYNKVAVVFNFLAVLELMALNKVTVEIGDGYNNFWVKQYHGPDIF